MKLSIITINYNNISGLKETALSVSSQSNKDFEWLVIDGGSIDGGKEFLENYHDYITYWVSEKDNGVYHAMNKGIHKAKGDYCLFLNSGDRLHAYNTIEKVLPELYSDDIISGDEWWVDKDYKFKKINTNPINLTPYRLLAGILWHQCTFIKRSLLLKHPYDESLIISSDWEEMFYELIVRKGSYRHIPFIISDFIDGGISENGKLIAKERGTVLDKYLTKKEQHTIALNHLSQFNDKVHNKQIAEIAFSSFVNSWYNEKDYKDLFFKYRRNIRKGSLKYSLFASLCFIGTMNTAKSIYNFMKSL